MRRVALLLLVLPACLARPEGRDQPPAIGAWPPPGIDIIAGRVLDLDRDGVDDLVLTSAGTGEPALYVLLGTRAGIGAGFHAKRATSAPALAMAIGDVSGDAEDDLVVLENVDDQGTRGRLEAFEKIDLVDFSPAWLAETPLLGTLSSDNAAIDIVDFEGDGNPDVFLADQLHSVIGRTTRSDEIGWNAMMFETQPAVPSNFAQPASAFTVDDPAGGRDLVVVSGGNTATYSQIARGQSIALHTTDPIDRETVFVSHTRCDLDDDGALDIIGGFGGWATDRPWPAARSVPYDQMPGFGNYGKLRATACASLDDDAANLPDLAKLWTPQDGHPQVEVLSDLVLDATPNLFTNRAAALIYPIPEPLPNVMVAGDFNGDGRRELMVVAHDGTLTCLTVNRDGIVPCAP